MTGPLFATPCACREMSIPYLCNVVPDIHGAMHRATHCDGMKITLLPEPDASPKPPPWTGSVLCEHGESWWITGPDPAALLAEQGCGCAEEGAA